MLVYVLLRNGRFVGVYRNYESAREAIWYHVHDSRFPDDYEILEERI